MVLISRKLVPAFLVAFLLVCSQAPASIAGKSIQTDSSKTHSSENPFKIQVKQGDTLYKISKQYGIEIRDLIELNRLRPPYTLTESQIIRLPQATFHIVKSGDTLYAVSRSYGVDIGRLAHINNLSYPYTMPSGLKLRIPSKSVDDEQTTVAINDSTPPPPVKKDIKENLSATLQKDLGLLDKPTESPDFVLPRKVTAQTVDNATPTPSLKANSYPSPELKPGTKYAEVTPTKEEVTFLEETTSVKESPFTEEEATTEESPFTEEEATTEESPFTKEEASTKEITQNNIEEEFQPAAYNFQNFSTVPSQGFEWPVNGKVISRFGAKTGGLYNDGINISAAEGSPIKAADSGIVVYSGNELRGYGNLVLIKHSNGYITAYAHTKDISVKKGDLVKKGDVIAHVGSTGHVSTPQLHFSIRKGRKALDPQQYLPS